MLCYGLLQDLNVMLNNKILYLVLIAINLALVIYLLTLKYVGFDYVLMIANIIIVSSLFYFLGGRNSSLKGCHKEVSYIMMFLCWVLIFSGINMHLDLKAVEDGPQESRDVREKMDLVEQYRRGGE